MSLREIREQFRSGRIDKFEYVARMHEFHRLLIDYGPFLEGSGIERIEIAEGKVLLTCRDSGVKLHYDDPVDQHVTPLTLLNFEAYEPEDSAMLFGLCERKFGTRPFTFLDIGANVGWYALNVARRFPAAVVHAFEPVPGIFANLAKNVAANGLDTVTLHNLGFMDREGAQDFFYDPAISGRTSARNLAGDPRALPVPCAVRCLNAFAAERGLAPDLLKVDVEGAELFVFQGARETLARHRPLVFTEMLRKWAATFGYHPDAILDLFAELGYRCHFVEEGRLVPLARMTDQVTATNFFFLHEQAHRMLLDRP